MHFSNNENTAKFPDNGKAKIIILYAAIFWIALPALLFLLGIRMNQLLPRLAYNIKALKMIGWIISIAGLLILSIAIFQLWRFGKGLPISHLPPNHLVDTGMYKIVRHPIYVGYNLLFAGASLIINLLWSAIISGLFLLIGWIAYVIYFEEPVLLRRYGELYRDYQSKVPLLLPQFLTAPLKNLFKKINNKTLSLFDSLANKTILFHIGGAVFVTYGVLISVGSLLFMIHTTALLAKQNIPFNDIAALIGGSTIFGIFLGRFFWYLGHWSKLKALPLFGIRKVGYVSFGDLTGIISFILIYSLIKGINFFIVSDAYFAGMFIAYFIGRVGCLTYGCCYGRECEHPGVMYRNVNSKVVREKGKQNNYRYPSQIYSSIHGLLLFVFLNIFMNLNIPAGMTTAMALMLYAVGRAFVEFYRDRRRIIKNIFTEGHIGCAIIFLTGVMIIFLINPDTGMNSERMWDLQIFTRSMSLFPFQLTLAFIVFIAAGFHWKKVGTW